MNKIVIGTSLIALLPVFSFAQCCNVTASNNTAVTTSDGACVSLLYSLPDCQQASVTMAATADSDGDGIVDKNDKCPNERGPIENMGCPVRIQEVWILFYTPLRDVRFATDSDSLTGRSFEKLDEVAMLMQKNPNLTLKISGYADSVGTQEYNKELSQKRAKAVKSYLHSKGLPDNRVVIAAYGEKFPKAPNETETGRSKNRRVEFDVY